jgi:regulator of RNase E activity RraA
VDNISIHKDDLIFGDSDGIIVVPKKHEAAILKEALHRKENEAGILLAIAQGIRTDELVQKFGLF